ncbi:MAG TPA: nitroreductase [candidate division Zixibacteria bacterium]|nr:nitroreductase [candidate division Zixibacteria bacterium]
MEFKDLITARKSIRSFTDAPLPDGALDFILEAGRLANSAKNRQKWAFVVVENSETKKTLVPACRNQAFVGESAVVIAVCATDEYYMSCDNPAHFIDASIALDHMQLAVADLGLGSCWLGAFNQDAVRDILGIPKDIIVVGLLVIGVPADQGRPKTRLPIEEIVHREKW